MSLTDNFRMPIPTNETSPSVLSLMWSSQAFKGLIGPLLFQVRPPPNHGDNKPHSYERNNAVLKPAAH